MRGPGVVGEQPLIAPGETHSYSSGTLMPTQVGSMRGSYQMVASDGHLFEAAIPTFRWPYPARAHRSPDDAVRRGDLQGCLDPLKCLLDEVRFDPAQDASGW